jgi:hypothetical protein
MSTAIRRRLAPRILPESSAIRRQASERMPDAIDLGLKTNLAQSAMPETVQGCSALGLLASACTKHGSRERNIDMPKMGGWARISASAPVQSRTWSLE